jgi:hypothetical protein
VNFRTEAEHCDLVLETAAELGAQLDRTMRNAHRVRGNGSAEANPERH